MQSHRTQVPSSQLRSGKLAEIAEDICHPEQNLVLRMHILPCV
ncbi:hypothetical protein [Synechococcus sp. PCC 7336]|nr:hypothetical protein [Synechococcus sp. PCC 7336]